MASLNNYRIYCITESAYVYEWNTVEPTQCPNNALHTINPSITTISESLKLNKYNTLVPNIKSIDSTVYSRIGIYEIPETRYAIIKTISWMDVINTSYTIKVYDKTNSVTLLETTLTNTSESIQTVGTLTDLPTIEMEIFVKKTGGDLVSKVYIESILICFS